MRAYSTPEDRKEYQKAYRERNPHVRRRAALKVFGLSLEAYDLLWAHQEGRCAACRRPMIPNGVSSTSVAVDHCHKTGKVRGLLHAGCNKALGHAKDDPAVLEGLAVYIRAKVGP